MGDRPKHRNGETGISPDFLQTHEVAGRLNISVSTLMRWRRLGRIPKYALPFRLTKQAKALSWSSRAVDAWVDSVTRGRSQQFNKEEAKS
ncbi:MAG: hypothetical protein ABGY10_04555 [bacterium]